jgi:hypothetical protein
MIFQRKYNLATAAETHIRIPIIKAGVVNFAVSADWTPATGDVRVKKDDGAWADIGTNPTASSAGGNGSSAVWVFQFSAAELSCKQLQVMVSDAATKAIEDQYFIIETFGNANAMYPSDISANNTDAENRFLSAVKGNVLGTVGVGSTTTSIVTSALDPAAAATDQFKGRILIFANNTTTANLRGQGTDITASTAGGVLTVSALSHAPANGDTFTIT